MVVPARNEEAGLGACLQSLVSQTGVNFELIVVDDASTDRTRQIAQSFAGVRVVDAGCLVKGWTGKNHAMWRGAQQAQGEWLLFTDADTVHQPGSLARAVAEAEQHGAALLSYSPEQEVHGFWEKAVMPVIFAELAATYPLAQVNDPASPLAAANGQYLLISREAYDSVGGHANPKIASHLLEDVVMARLLKSSGRKIFFRFGGDAVRTRMYRSFTQLQEGWTKNLVLLFPSPVRLAGLRLTEFGLIVGSVAVAITVGLRGRWQAAAPAAMLAGLVCAAFLKRSSRAHFSWDANALAPLGLPIFSYLLLRSSAAYKTGSIPWKRRTYPSRPRDARSETRPRSPTAVFRAPIGRQKKSGSSLSR